MTPVIFRVDKKSKEIVAFFPTLPADNDGRFMTCYQHIGQHGSAAYVYYLQCRPLLSCWNQKCVGEYMDLKEELKSIGYDDLVEYARIQPWMRDQDDSVTRIEQVSFEFICKAKGAK